MIWGRFIAGLDAMFSESAQRTQTRLCAHIERHEALLSDDERQFVSLMRERLKDGLALHDSHAKRLGEIHALVQGDLAW